MPARTSETDETIQKARYLRALAKIGTMTAGTKAAKISHNTVYKWREHDEAFTYAERQAREECADALEASVIKRAKGRSDILAMFMLKAMRPEKYREVVGVKHSGGINTSDEDDLDARLEARLATMVGSGEIPSTLATRLSS